jgi:cytochrome c oxidase subunit I+III
MSSVGGHAYESDGDLSAQLTSLWKAPTSIVSWLATVDHKALGLRYIYTASAFFIAGGIEAAIMRAQLARPDGHLVSPEMYNQLFTMHGVTMMFLFVQPVLSGFSFYLVPLLIGARELAFPRLNSFSYYVFLLAGVFMYASFLNGQAPNNGWFNYAPLSGPMFNAGLNIDFYALGLLFLGISTTVGAANLIVTILHMRAPGMSIDRMPLLLWSSLTMSVAVIFAIPSLTVALGMLELERHWRFAFFQPALGGSPMLWQHLFWVFGHPWVYIVFLPATGMLSMVIPTFARRPMVGHSLVALATVTTGLIGFGVWVHHMFATGLPQLSMSFFGAASMAVSIPSAIQIVAWIVTMWFGRVVFATPMLFALAFIVQFVIGGISGVMTAAVPFDLQATDTYFVVGHIHYVLAGGTVFGVLAALYYWYPKMFGRMLSERLGKLSFGLTFIGFNVAFFPMHIAGLLGMPRRIYTYSADSGWAAANMASTIGAYVFAIGLAVTLYNIARSRFAGAPAGANPWGAASLEWLAASPPERFNFARIPIVSTREPLWTDGVQPGPAWDAGRLSPRTSVLDADLEDVVELPDASIWPVVMSLFALGGFAALLVRWEGSAAVLFALTLLSAALWMWPTPGRKSTEAPVPGAADSVYRKVGFWAMVLFCITEATIFTYLLSSYFFLGVSNTAWPPPGSIVPALPKPLLMTAFLISSSVVLLFAERARVTRGARAYRIGVLATMALGLGFLVLQMLEYRDKLPMMAPSSSSYASTFYLITGFHGSHVCLGLLILGWTLIADVRGRLRGDPPVAVKNSSLYWHFVDGVWLVILTCLYLSPRWY